MPGVKAHRASEAESLADVTEWVSTSFPGLDEIFGGGLHVGRVSEVFGPEGSGKSALTHACVVAAQQNGSNVVYFDFEHSLEKRIFDQLGIDATRLVYFEPQYVEQGTDLLLSVLDKLIANPPEKPTLIIWDSVGASQSKAEFEAEAGAHTPAARAAAVKKLVGKLYNRAPEARAHVLLVNQERVVMNMGGGKRGGFQGPVYETTGGSSAKYAFSLRVRCARVATLKLDGTTGPACGYLIKVTTKKNKCSPPHQSAVFVLDFKYGPSPDMTMWQVLKDANKIRHVGGGLYSGSWANGIKFGKREGWMKALQDEPELRKLATEAYLGIVRAAGANALLQIGEDSGDTD